MLNIALASRYVWSYLFLSLAFVTFKSVQLSDEIVMTKAVLELFTKKTHVQVFPNVYYYWSNFCCKDFTLPTLDQKEDIYCCNYKHLPILYTLC